MKVKGEKMKVKITKLNQVSNPVVKTAVKDNYICGKEQDEEVSLFNGYCAIGVLERDIECGKSIRMLREDRNGVKAFGLFVTSPVKSINSYEGYTIANTDNSIYKIEYDYKG